MEGMGGVVREETKKIDDTGMNCHGEARYFVC